MTNLQRNEGMKEMREEMKGKWLYRGIKIALIVTAAIAVFGFIVKGLWNGLMPPIFGWRSITFLQAIGILLLSKILFGGFRGRGGMNWRHRMGERWEKMSPEEREKFSGGMRRCFSRRGFQPEEQKS
jgi:hypothetical protein